MTRRIAQVAELADRIADVAGRLDLPDAAAPGPARIVVDDVTAWFDAADWMSDAQRRCIGLVVRLLGAERAR